MTPALLAAVVLVSAPPGVPYAWEPSSGPVAGYEVRVEGAFVGTTPATAFWVPLVDGQRVTVRAYDAEGSPGPWSPASEPYDAAAVAEERARRRGDFNGDCIVGLPDAWGFAAYLGESWECGP